MNSKKMTSKSAINPCKYCIFLIFVFFLLYIYSNGERKHAAVTGKQSKGFCFFFQKENPSGRTAPRIGAH